MKFLLKIAINTKLKDKIFYCYNFKNSLYKFRWNFIKKNKNNYNEIKDCNWIPFMNVEKSLETWKSSKNRIIKCKKLTFCMNSE